MLPARPSRCCFAPAEFRRKGGFTLIELLAAMGVVAILAGIAVGMIRSGKQRSAIAQSRGELAALVQALETYKIHYGDYPQTGSAGQANPIVTADIQATQAQSLLFNALLGVYGPTDFTVTRNGPAVVELAKFRVEETREYTQRVSTNSLGVATGNPPAKARTASAFLDAWGNRYLYYYKPAPAPGRPPANTWRLPGFVLYSAGPNGQHTPPNQTTGLFTGTTQTTGTNADNLYATP